VFIRYVLSLIVRKPDEKLKLLSADKAVLCNIETFAYMPYVLVSQLD